MELSPVHDERGEEAGEMGIERRRVLASMGMIGLIGATAGAALGQPVQGPQQPGPPSPKKVIKDTKGQPEVPRRAGATTGIGWDAAKGEFVLPPLPYAFEALEPHIDTETMKIHHGKHHAAYVVGANRAMAELAKIREGGGDPQLVKFWSRELAFHGSGHANHTLFWQIMAPTNQGGGGSPQGILGEAINAGFGTFEKFMTHFKLAAVQVEGSGWAWLVYQPMSGRLLVMQGEKQQDMTSWGVRPIMGVDVWEHAYYLKYQNKRQDYLNAFVNVISWGKVGELYALATGAPGRSL